LTNGESGCTSGVLSLTPDFFHEIEYKKIDAEVTKYVTTNNKNQITPKETPVKKGVLNNNHANEITPEKIEVVESDSNKREHHNKKSLKNKLNINMNGWDTTSKQNEKRMKRGNDKTGHLKKNYILI